MLASPPAQNTILDRLATLGDPIRCRILLLLEQHELAVSELCSTLQLPQSTVSRHLKVLSTDDWVLARKHGTSRLYTARLQDSSSARDLWELVRAELATNPAVDEDRRRLAAVLAQRSSGSREFFSSASDRWAEMRHEIFGQRFDLSALLALLPEDAVVGDLGTGTGHVALSIAPYVNRVVAVDDSPEMLDAASKRMTGVGNVDLRSGKLEALPIDDGTLDISLLMLVLHHLPEPQRAFAEVARTLKPGGKLLIVDMLPHEHDEYRQAMGHIWLGFDRSQIEEWCTAAGLSCLKFHRLTPEPDAVGPSLFAATATTTNAA